MKVELTGKNAKVRLDGIDEIRVESSTGHCVFMNLKKGSIDVFGYDDFGNHVPATVAQTESRGKKMTTIFI